MPISSESGNLGTEKDGSASAEYCKFCCQNGKFTLPELTAQGMLEHSVKFMTENLGFSEEKARKMSNAVIPKLKRWKR